MSDTRLNAYLSEEEIREGSGLVQPMAQCAFYRQLGYSAWINRKGKCVVPIIPHVPHQPQHKVRAPKVF